jgi:ABC-type nitrate/sulfonate/bicarbonate transport system substrate-binding protein
VIRGWRWRTVQVVLLSWLLAGGTALAAPLTALVIANDGVSICNAPMFVGTAKGIFQKYGLEIQETPAANGFVSLQRVVHGAAQIGTAAPTVIAQTMAQGADLKSIFAGCGDATGRAQTDDVFVVVARKVSGIRGGHLEDLRGKKIGFPARGAVVHQYLYYALAARGLDINIAVTAVVAPPGGLAGALLSGAVDAVVAGSGGLDVLQSVADAVVVQRGGNYIQFMQPRAVLASYLATHPGTIKRYATAYAEAARYVRAHPDETTDIMMQRVPGVSRERMRAVVGYLGSDMRVSKATAQTAQQGYDFAIKIGALKQAPTLGEVFDLRILRQVEREHPEFFRDLPPIPDALRL